MKSRCFIKNQEGSAYSIVFLAILPLLLFLLISNSEISRIKRVTSTTLENSVEIAVKDATMMVDPESQAYGEPRIVHKKAIERFKKNLQKDLRLNSDLSPTVHSSVEEVKYWVVIYNGDGKYKGYKVANNPDNEVYSYAYYTNENSFETVELDNTSIQGFPLTVGITNDGFSTYITENVLPVNITHPGIVAIVKVKIKPVMAKEGEYATRWAYGRIALR